MKNKPLPDAPADETASSEDALRFVRGLQEKLRHEPPEDQQALIEQHLDRLTLSQLRGIGQRILMDIMKRPQISTEAGPEPEPEAPGLPAPSRGRPRRATGTRRPPARER